MASRKASFFLLARIPFVGYVKVGETQGDLEDGVYLELGADDTKQRLSGYVDCGLECGDIKVGARAKVDAQAGVLGGLFGAAKVSQTKGSVKDGVYLEFGANNTKRWLDGRIGLKLECEDVKIHAQGSVLGSSLDTVFTLFKLDQPFSSRDEASRPCLPSETEEVPCVPFEAEETPCVPFEVEEVPCVPFEVEEVPCVPFEAEEVPCPPCDNQEIPCTPPDEQDQLCLPPDSPVQPRSNYDKSETATPTASLVSLPTEIQPSLASTPKARDDVQLPSMDDALDAIPSAVGSGENPPAPPSLYTDDSMSVDFETDDVLSPIVDAHQGGDYITPSVPNGFLASPMQRRPAIPGLVGAPSLSNGPIRPAERTFSMPPELVPASGTDLVGTEKGVRGFRLLIQSDTVKTVIHRARALFQALLLCENPFPELHEAEKMANTALLTAAESGGQATYQVLLRMQREADYLQFLQRVVSHQTVFVRLSSSREGYAACSSYWLVSDKDTRSLGPACC
jgi:hypothetical protein